MSVNSVICLDCLCQSSGYATANIIVSQFHHSEGIVAFEGSGETSDSKNGQLCCSLPGRTKVVTALLVLSASARAAVTAPKHLFVSTPQREQSPILQVSISNTLVTYKGDIML